MENLFYMSIPTANDYSHAIEKLTMVLECLATHPGDARQRVASAYSLSSHLRVEELPEKCQADWKWIKKEVTKFGTLTDYKGDVWKGSVENTMKTVRNSTGVKIAKRFYKLYWAVSKNTQYA
jgi:hypothetical protein